MNQEDPRREQEPVSGPTGDEQVDQRLAEYSSAEHDLLAADATPTSMAVDSVDDATRASGNADETETVFVQGELRRLDDDAGATG